MNRILDLLKALISSPWLPLVAAVVFALALARACNRADRAERDVERQREAAALVAQHLVVAEQDRDAARSFADNLTKQNDILAKERDRAIAAAHDARVALAAALRTGPLVAGGTPRPSPAPAGPGAAPATPACLLAPGDTGDIRVDQLELETGAGNRVIIGTAQAWRLTPAPETLLFGGPFRSELSHVAVDPPPREPGWGGGLVASVGAGGVGLGAVLAFPPIPTPILGWQFEAAVGATFVGDQRFIGQIVVRP